MGKQYRYLTDKDTKFIKNQKLFYLASSSGKEVNLSPKGYDTIRVMDKETIIFLNYPGSGNRTYSDTIGDGEFTLLFNAFEGDAKILRLFCKATLIRSKSEAFDNYVTLFDAKKSLVRDFFEFHIYAIESSCGESVPFMEYKGERKSLKNWVIKMDEKGKLEQYIQDHIKPPSLKNL